MTYKSRRHTRRSSSKVLRLSSFNHSEASKMNKVMRQGPMTIMLVYSTTCPHCHTYMPIWNKLCQTKGRKANMISMEASVYNQTPLAQKKPVSGVPSVLYIGADGQPVEIENPRDSAKMSSIIRSTPSLTMPKSMSQSSSQLSGPSSQLSGSSSQLSGSSSQPSKPSSQLSRSSQLPTSSSQSPSSMSITSNPTSAKKLSSMNISFPKSSRMINSPLRPLPAQAGGSWEMIMNAVPAAALLGAYAAFPMQRSSGLGPTRRRRRHR